MALKIKFVAGPRAGQEIWTTTTHGAACVARREAVVTGATPIISDAAAAAVEARFQGDRLAGAAKAERKLAKTIDATPRP